MSDISIRVVVGAATLTICSVLASSVVGYVQVSESIEVAFGEEALAIANTLAGGVDGSSHEGISKEYFELFGEMPEEFDAIRALLVEAKKRNGLSGHGSPIYTMRESTDFRKTARLEFVVMTDVGADGKFFVGNQYHALPHQLRAMGGTPNYTPIYTDDEGTWISAASPLHDQEGEVVGVLQVDRHVEDYHERVIREVAPVLVASFIAMVAVALFTRALLGMILGERKRREELEQALIQLNETREQLIESEKLASLGGLVAGVAHEINTPVGVAVTASSRLLELTSDTKIAMDAGSLKKSGLVSYFTKTSELSELLMMNLRRASDLIRSFKMVSADRTSVEQRTFELKEFLSDVVRSLAPRLRLTPHLVELDCPGGIEVTSFPGALSQVIINLVMNALTHAFSSEPSGTVHISATLVEGCVRLSLRDDGKGISADNLEKIFDPFFTTNRQGGGTGLGLNIVYNAVTGTLGGHIHCESVEGEGTIFSVHFPQNVDSSGHD